MMTALSGALLAISTSLAASLVAKVTISTALGLLGAWLARRNRAAVRHALLAASFGVLLLLPIASVVAPPVRIAVKAAEERIAPGFAAAAGIPSPARPRVSAPSEVLRLAGPSMSVLLLAGWLAGAVLFLLPVATGLRQVRSLRRAALPWPEAQPAVDKLTRGAGIHRRVEVLLHGALPGPMTCGVVHPAIVLPLDAQTWDEEDLHRALVHELEHVRRGDWVSHCLARAVCAAYWFHPLVWIAGRRIELEAERACDDAVLGCSEATAYADQLVELAQRLSLAQRSRSAKSPLLAMANRADLATRVGAVLDGRQRRGRAGWFPVALACTAAAVLVLALSPLRLVAAPQAVSSTVGSASVPQFLSTTKLVVTDVIVSGQNGASIDGLGPNDFAVSEDGVAQIISVFEFQKPAGASSYYSVGYYPRNTEEGFEYRKIQITLEQNTAAKLRYRDGYYPNRNFSGVPRPSAVDNATVPDASAPVLLRKVEPAYSEEARKAKWQGFVLLDVQVNASGDVISIQVNRPLGLGLDQKAITAVEQWKFKPGTKDGQPVFAQVQVQMNFRLL